MAKKIHLTETQIEEILDKLNEGGAGPVIDVTQDIVANSGNASVGIQKAKQRLPQQGLSGKDAQFTFDPDAVVSECYTKKQIKEAKLRYLKEHSTAYSKKAFKNRFIER